MLNFANIFCNPDMEKYYKEVISASYINGTRIAILAGVGSKNRRGVKMDRKPIDFVHRILTHNWVILSVGIMLALLIIFTEK